MFIYPGEAFSYKYYDRTMLPEPLNLSSRLERFFIGRSNSSNYSAKWKADFEIRPTWCDADLTLQAMKRGYATGNTAALYSRSFIQNTLYNLGHFVQKNSLKVFITIFILFAICSYGLKHVQIETDIVKLWVSQDGRLVEELNYFSYVQDKFSNRTLKEEDLRYLLPDDSDPHLKDRPEDEGASQGYQVLIQTGNDTHSNLLTTDGLKQHVKLLQHLVDIKIEKYGKNWTLSDICFKPGGLDISNDSIAYSMKPMLERLIPCIWITPIDCYYDGSKPIGPHPPIDASSFKGLLSMFIDLPDDVTWGNINPEEVITSLAQMFDIGTVKDFFIRTGIGSGYLSRPCIDPLDPTCPKLSPNYYNECSSLNILKQNLTTINQTLDDLLEKEEEKQEDNFTFDILGAFLGMNQKVDLSNSTDDGLNEYGNDTLADDVISADECKKYRKSFLKWINENKNEAELIFGKENMPVYPDYGKIMKNGCQGFAKNVLNWPKDMIMGGVRQKDDGSIEAEALQSVILVSTPTDVYKRLKATDKVDDLNDNSNDNQTLVDWTPAIAEEIISLWQREFTQSIYNHELNFKVDIDGSITEKRVVHPLASTSISDMLAEYCNFDYRIILLGYFFMLIYAIYSQFRCDYFCLMSVDSFIGLAFAGILTVTFASIAGLGLATWFGIHFNAATTQVLPFLALGVGVDNVFLLLFNYPHATTNKKLSEIGVLMKETGMSILITSMNHILSFLAGTVLPIPALRSFCLQISILLTFNLIAVMTLYPAIISFDYRRKKSLRRDMCCFLQVSEDQKDSKDTSYNLIKEQPVYRGLLTIKEDVDEDEELEEVPGPNGLQLFLKNYYVPLLKRPIVKILVIILTLCLFTTCLIGLKYSTMGLDLGDVLPENTAPAAFLRARDKYFSFYPMSIILRGDNLNFAEQQNLIRLLREEIGQSKYVVKLGNSEPSEKYWFGLFQDWLKGLQLKVDEAKKNGILDNINEDNKNLTNELKIAISMICSYGKNYNCTRIKDDIKLIDGSDTINKDGFYNYLYAWHEYENMFYTVSQGNFFPKLNKLRQGNGINKYRHYIPPAPQPIYSQIPFYLTGLKDTKEIIEMIKEVREICEKYQSMGLDNYPSGIPFTFFEQYLDLTKNLIMAISYIAFAVFCVISILLFNPWTASCILIILLMLTIEIAGFLGLCGIKLNPVSAVSLITAVGIGVEFTANVAFAFLTSLGTRNDRMGIAIEKVFVPIIHGAVSTFLGILMLGFSEFEFVFKYFFVILFALIAIGLMNGLAFFPVLISLIGPPCEIKPTGGRNRLIVPPVLPKNRSGYSINFSKNPSCLLQNYG